MSDILLNEESDAQLVSPSYHGAGNQEVAIPMYIGITTEEVMSESRAAAAIQRLAASRASRAAWDSFWAADATSSRLLAAAKDAGELSAALDAERMTVAAEAADAKSSRLLAAARDAEDLSARLLSAALDAERVAVAAEAAFAAAVKRFPQEGD